MPGDETLIMGPAELEASASLSIEKARPPVVIPGYVPERILGNGSFGEVWVARDTNTDLRVAIKFFSQRGGLDWSFLSREVEKLKFLGNNRHIVQLLKVGWESRPPYFIMEYCDHGSLEEFLKGETIPVPAAVEMIREIAQGLVISHERGVFHCDLKPANVLLDAEHRPRLADFGQARLQSEQNPSLGTLFYMAPDQADRTSMPDSRWDVYALGAILYRMVVGSPPHSSPEITAKIKQGKSLDERLSIYRLAVQKEGKPTAHRSVRGIDRSLIDLIDKCLEPNPKKRLASPQLFLTALDQRALSLARRPLLVVGVLGPLLFLLVVAVIAWLGFNTTIQSTTREITERENLSNRFAARFVAETVANQFEERFNKLTQSANEEQLRDWLRRHASDKSIGKNLQNWLTDLDNSTTNVFSATSWFLTDAEGHQLARFPASPETLGRDYSYRDYFHGQGKNLLAGTKTKPITQPHLSKPFISMKTNTRLVAFTVPVWSSGANDPTRSVLGVLGMTVEIGQFGELQSEDPVENELHGQHTGRIAVLVDTREDADQRRGLILQHPAFNGLQLSHEFDQQNLSALDLPAYYFGPDLVEKMRKLAQKRTKGIPAVPMESLEKGDSEPVAKESLGSWLFAVEPVILHQQGKDTVDTGLSIVVETRENTVTEPIQRLEASLRRRGVVGLALIVTIIVTLWGFVLAVLNSSTSTPLGQLIRRRAGLPKTQTSSGTGKTGATPAGKITLTEERTPAPVDSLATATWKVERNADA